MMGWYGGGAGWATMIVNSLFGLLLIAVVVWAVLRLTAPGGQRPGGDSGSEARRILDRRFAEGEIDVETYRAAVRELSGGQGR